MNGNKITILASIYRDKLDKIEALEVQKSKNDAYFTVICEALEIPWESSLTEILIAIDNLGRDI